ncbi:MAG: two-component regulator propeller domain-containing protein, partial [Acidobacteriota bacterium]
MSHDPLDKTSIARSPQNAIVADEQGILWIPSEDGLAMHVPSTAKITLVHPRPEPGASARSIDVSSVVEARDGAVWVGTGEGLERLTEIDRSGGALRIDRFVHDPADPTSLASKWVYTVMEDRAGQLWVGTVRGGLHRLGDDGPTPRFERFPQESSGLSAASVFCLFEDAAGVLWVGTYLGLFHSTPAGSAQPFERLDPAVGTPSSELFYSLAEDASGRLWIGTDHGLDRLSADRQRLEPNVLKPGLVALAIAEGPDGILWLAAASEGLISVDPATDEWRAW